MLYSHGGVGSSLKRNFSSSDSILDLFSDLQGESDKDLLFSFLKHMPGTAREVSRYLKVFSSAENHRFAVIKVGGAVVEENLDELAKQLAFLYRVGLLPVVVHGGGPQLNKALQNAGMVLQTSLTIVIFIFFQFFFSFRH